MKYSVINGCAHIQTEQLFFENPETGSIVLRSHILVTIPCMSSLRKFPFDQVECMLAVMPKEFEYQYLQVQWSETGVIRAYTFDSLPDFYIENIIANSSITTIGSQRSELARMEVVIRFRRYYGFFVMQGYVPHILIVVLMGLSFFLNPHSMHGRAGFGISTFVAMIMQYSAILSSLPKVGYIKVIEIKCEKMNEVQAIFYFNNLIHNK